MHCHISWGGRQNILHLPQEPQETVNVEISRCSILIFECINFYIRGNNHWPLGLFQIFGINQSQEQPVFPMIYAHGTLGEIVAMFDLNHSKVSKDRALWTTCFYLKHSLPARNRILFV